MNLSQVFMQHFASQARDVKRVESGMYIAVAKREVFFEADGSTIVACVEEGGLRDGDWVEGRFSRRADEFPQERVGDVGADLEDASWNCIVPYLEAKFGGELREE